MTGIGYDIDIPSELFNHYCPCDLHVIGKDIVKFHTIYWTIFLIALGISEKIIGHQWLFSKNNDDEILKMCK